MRLSVGDLMMKNSVNFRVDLFSVLSVLKIKSKLSPDEKFGIIPHCYGIAFLLLEATHIIWGSNPDRRGRDCANFRGSKLPHPSNYFFGNDGLMTINVITDSQLQFVGLKIRGNPEGLVNSLKIIIL
ncbi:MAG: hypothetical protein ACLQQ4_14330 [Bacteroidia bacterium]